MSKPSRKTQRTTYATRDDIRRVFGELETKDVLEILTMEPSVAELEEAGAWLEGQGDVVARRDHPQSTKIAAILSIVDEDDDFEEPSYLR